MEEAAWPSSSTHSCPLWCSTQFVPVRLPGRWWGCSDCSRAAVFVPLHGRRCSFWSLLILHAVTAHIKEWMMVHSAYHIVSPLSPNTPYLLLCNLSTAALLSQVCSWLQDDTLPLSHFGSGFQRGMHLMMSGRTGIMLRHWWVPLTPGHYVYLQETWVRGSVSAYFWVIETELLSSPSVGWQL